VASAPRIRPAGPPSSRAASTWWRECGRIEPCAHANAFANCVTPFFNHFVSPLWSPPKTD
jgi:hypothetical protein